MSHTENTEGADKVESEKADARVLLDPLHVGGNVGNYVMIPRAEGALWVFVGMN